MEKKSAWDQTQTGLQLPQPSELGTSDLWHFNCSGFWRFFPDNWATWTSRPKLCILR